MTPEEVDATIDLNRITFNRRVRAYLKMRRCLTRLKFLLLVVGHCPICAAYVRIENWPYHERWHVVGSALQ